MKNAMRAFFSLFVAISVLVEPPKPFSLLAPRSSTSKTDNLALELSQIPPLPVSVKQAVEFYTERYKRSFWIFLDKLRNFEEEPAKLPVKLLSQLELREMFKMLQKKVEDIKDFWRYKRLGAAVAAKIPGAFNVFKAAVICHSAEIRNATLMGIEPALRAKFYGVFELLKERVGETAAEVLGIAVAVGYPGALELFEQKLMHGSWAERWGAGKGLKAVVLARCPDALKMLEEALKYQNTSLTQIVAESLGAAIVTLPGGLELFKKTPELLRWDGDATEIAMRSMLGIVAAKTKKEQQQSNLFLKELPFNKAFSFLYLVSEEKGKNLFQQYYEKEGNLRPFEALAQLDAQLLWEGAHSFKDFFEEEFLNDITFVEEMTEFLQTLQKRKISDQSSECDEFDDRFNYQFDVNVMRRINVYLKKQKHSFKEFFNQVKEKELFYEHLKFLYENKKQVFSLPLEWLQSDLSQKFFNHKVVHRIGADLLISLVETKNKEEQEVVFKEIFEKIKQTKIWPDADVASFKDGAEVFGYGALFGYLGRHENVHEALFSMNDILKTHELMGVTPKEFVSQILFQVARDSSVDAQGRNSYQLLRNWPKPLWPLKRGDLKEKKHSGKRFCKQDLH